MEDLLKEPGVHDLGEDAKIPQLLQGGIGVLGRALRGRVDDAGYVSIFPRIKFFWRLSTAKSAKLRMKGSRPGLSSVVTQDRFSSCRTPRLWLESDMF